MTQEQSREASLPIVEMHNLRLPWQMQSQMSDCLGEKNESLGIVRVVNSLLLVKAGSLVKFRRVHEVNCEARGALERPDATGNAPRSQWQLQLHASRFHLWKPLAHS